MDEKSFITIAFCSVIGIAVICIATLYFMGATGSVIAGTGPYYWAGSGHYNPEYGSFLFSNLFRTDYNVIFFQ